MLDNFDDLDIPEDEEISSGEGNRSFLTVAGGIGSLIVVALLMLAAYVFFFRPDPAANIPATEVDNSELIQQATSDALYAALTETAMVKAYTPTATNTSIPPTATEVVIVEEPEEEAPALQDPLTATVEALLTQASMAQTQAALTTGTPTPLADGELPVTGFLDDFGIPGLVSLSLLMVFVIFIARRLRQVNT